MGNLLEQDLDFILENTGDLWRELSNKQLFITGGTGFFGCWLLESFAWANDHLGLNSKAVVLTRNIESFKRKAPHLASHHALRFHIGDVRNFAFPEGEFSHVIHAATEAAPRINEEKPLAMLDGIVQGTRHCLEFAVHCKAKKFLLTSSGAIYGKQPPEMTHIPETYAGAPDPMDVGSTYGEGKRTAELLCAIYARKHTIETKIARCFAFVGPYLPLDMHFAIGNFIRDAMSGSPLRIKGDGSPYRSYLYAADLAICLWTILFEGTTLFPYNVGSDKELTIKELAEEVAAAIAPGREIRIEKQRVSDSPSERYVPSVERLQRCLNLMQQVELSDAIQRTNAWYSKKEMC